MSISLVASTGAYSTMSGTTVTTSAINCSTADFLVVVCGSYAEFDLGATLSDSEGNTWTLVTNEETSNGIGLFYAASPVVVGSSQTFTWKHTGGSAAPYWILVLAFSGAGSYSPSVSLINAANASNFNAGPSSGSWEVYTQSLIISAVSVEAGSSSYPSIGGGFSSAVNTQSPDFHPFSNYLSSVAAWLSTVGSTGIDSAWSGVSGTLWDGLNVAFSLPVDGGGSSYAFLA